MRLSDLLKVENITLSLESSSKQAIIEELLDLAMNSGNINSKQGALEGILKREELMSTGLEKGIAVPHAKTAAVDEMTIALGINKEGVDFDSADGQPSRLFFLLLAPEAAAGPNVKALGQIARLTSKSSFCEDLMDAASPAEVLNIIRQLEL